MNDELLQEIDDFCDVAGLSLNESEILGNLLNAYTAQYVTSLITECSYSGVVDGIATSIIEVDTAIKYADRLNEIAS